MSRQSFMDLSDIDQSNQDQSDMDPSDDKSNHDQPDHDQLDHGLEYPVPPNFSDGLYRVLGCSPPRREESHRLNDNIMSTTNKRPSPEDPDGEGSPDPNKRHSIGRKKSRLFTPEKAAKKKRPSRFSKRPLGYIINKHFARTAETRVEEVKLPIEEEAKTQAEGDKSRAEGEDKTQETLIKFHINIYQTILWVPVLFYEFAQRIPLSAWLDLYATDRQFHRLVNLRLSHVIQGWAENHTPTARLYIDWKNDKSMHVLDPDMRPMNGKPHLVRPVPCFTWLKKLEHVEHTCREILTHLALQGHLVPKDTDKVLIKYWSLTELPSEKQRVDFLAMQSAWSDADLQKMILFVVKLDMLFGDPVRGRGTSRLSVLLLSQKGLSTLAAVMTGRTQFEYLSDVRILLRKTYLDEDLDVETHPILTDEADHGVPEEEEGLMRREGFSQYGLPMQRALHLVYKEIIRRGVRLDLLSMLSYGYIDPRTGMNIPVPRVAIKGDKEDVKDINDYITVTEKSAWPKTQEVRAEKWKWERMAWLNTPGRAGLWHARRSIMFDTRRAGHSVAPRTL